METSECDFRDFTGVMLNAACHLVSVLTGMLHAPNCPEWALPLYRRPPAVAGQAIKPPNDWAIVREQVRLTLVPDLRIEALHLRSAAAGFGGS